jgi:hypothetical protein
MNLVCVRDLRPKCDVGFWVSAACPLDRRVFLTCKTPALCNTSDNNESKDNKDKKRNDRDGNDGDDAETSAWKRRERIC